MVPKVRAGLQACWRLLKADAAGVACAIVFGATGLILFSMSPPSWRPQSDGFYSYIYARSLAFDFDIDFSNDYALCGDPFSLGHDRGTGHLDNIFYPGPALLWVPLLWFLRILGVSSSSCGPPWTAVCLGCSSVVASLAIFTSYRFVRHLHTPGVSALSVALMVFGGPALVQAAATPSYSHIYDWFFTSLTILLSHQLASRPLRRRELGFLAIALGCAILQRLSNVFLVLLPLAAVLQKQGGLRTRAGPLTATGVGVLLGLAPMLCIHAYLYGSPFTLSHGPYFLRLTQPHPFLVLFDAKAGVFLYWPTMWLAVFGGAWALLRKRPSPFAIAAVALVCLDLYLNSTATDWAGARRFLHLTPLVCAATAELLEGVKQKFLQHPRRGLALAGILLSSPLLLWATGFARSLQLRWVGEPLHQKDVYGSSVLTFWSLIDEKIGTVPILPAEVWFHLRYGLPGSSFGEAAFPRYFTRNPFSLIWTSRRIDLQSLYQAGLTEGLSPTPGGMSLTQRPARCVFATQWQRATHLTLTGRTTIPVSVSVSLGKRALGKVELSSSSASTLTLPDNIFGSGMHELILEVEPSAAADAVTLRALELDDRSSYRKLYLNFP